MTDNEMEDRHEIASIIDGCLRDGYCTASQLARRIAQAGYGNVKQAVKEFAEKLKSKLYDLEGIVQEDDIDELLKEYGVEVEE